MSSLFSRGFNKKPHSLFQCQETESESSIEELKKLNEGDDKITLDPQQDEIVHSDANNIIVVAAAGSGKTRVLTERIRYLIKDKKVPAHNIVSITFTNMAAEEMRMRLSNLNNIGDAFIGTIHSFANHIMKESGEKYTLLSDELDIQLHKELINKYCSHLTEERYLDFKDLEAKVAVGKANERELSGFFAPSEMSEYSMLHYPVEIVNQDIKDNTHLTFGESIATLCKKRGIITFDELLVKARKYFEKIQARLEYCFVDELQDVGTLEYSFIKSLNSENYFFVGDDYQAIYGFKGGNVSIFKGLCNNPDFTQYMLTNNYRNGTDILDVADYVISQVDNRIEKEIVPISKEKGNVTINTKNYIFSLLCDMSKKVDDFREYFLLVRTNKELFEMTNKCESIGLPYVTFKREGMTLADLKKKMQKNAIKILTVHTSKGLEADHVILYGNFPLQVPYYRKNDEERKVMYVGITRARKSITILN